MSPNPIRRSAAPHTYEAAINFGQVSTLPHDGAPTAPQMQRAQASWHPASNDDGLAGLFPAHDGVGISLVDLSGLETDRGDGAGRDEDGAVFAMAETNPAGVTHATHGFAGLAVREVASGEAADEIHSEPKPAPAEGAPAWPTTTEDRGWNCHDTGSRRGVAGLDLADVIDADDPLDGVLDDALLLPPGLVPSHDDGMSQDPVRNDESAPRDETAPWPGYRPDPLGIDVIHHA